MFYECLNQPAFTLNNYFGYLKVIHNIVVNSIIEAICLKIAKNSNNNILLTIVIK